MISIKRYLSSCKIKLAINCTVGLAVILLLCAGIYTLSYIARQQSAEYHAKQAELSELNSKLEAVQEDIVRLQREKERLKTPQGVEDAARSKLGMIRPGEVVYVSDSAESVPPSANMRYDNENKDKAADSGASSVFKVLGNMIY